MTSQSTPKVKTASILCQQLPTRPLFCVSIEPCQPSLGPGGGAACGCYLRLRAAQAPGEQNFLLLRGRLAKKGIKEAAKPYISSHVRPPQLPARLKIMLR